MAFDPDHPALLYVAGNNGSGKSTLCAKLAARLALHHPAEHQYDKSYLYDLFSQQRRWSFEAQIHFLALKAATVRSAVAGSAKAIIDRSPYEDAEVFARYFYETRKMDRRSYRTYQQLYESLLKDLPDPSLVIYCRCSAAELRRRIAGRDRRYEELYPSDHLDLLESLYEAWLARIVKRFPGRIVTVDSEAVDFRADDQAMEQLAVEVLDALESPQMLLSFDGPKPLVTNNVVSILKPPAPKRAKKNSSRKLQAYLAAPFTGKTTEASAATNTSVSEDDDQDLFDLSTVRTAPHGRIRDDEYRRFLESIELMVRASGYDTFLPHRDINRWGDRILSPQKAAAECTRHVFSADVVIAMPQLSLGAHYEIGVAIGYGLPLVVLIQGDEETGFLTPGLSSLENAAVIRFDAIDDLRTRMGAVLTDLARRLRP